MTVYRILQNLTNGTPRGSLKSMRLKPDTEAVLVMVGAIAPVAAPPLIVLPGWKTRGKKLAGSAYEMTDAFLEGDNTVLADLLGVKADTIRGYKDEIERLWLAAPADGS